MRKIISISAIVLFVGVASANAQSNAPARGSDHYRGQTVARGIGVDSVRERADRRARRNTGPRYGRGYMNCINSGHPADFCQNDSSDFRGF
jgi:hypothetical protein